MDNITMCSKMRIYERPGDRVICLLSSGNLSLTQATIALIDEDLHLGGSDPGREQLTNRQTLYETVCYVGAKVREVERRDRAALEADGFQFYRRSRTLARFVCRWDLTDAEADALIAALRRHCAAPARAAE